MHTLTVRGDTPVRRVRRDHRRGRGDVSASAINSPQLLMLYGIGHGSSLRAYGIHVVRDLPELGGNVRDHPAVALGYRIEPVENEAQGWRYRPA